jgi:tRNA-Thr(GGU) m(6)t(6)A37 methyltransferase TsaA
MAATAHSAPNGRTSPNGANEAGSHRLAFNSCDPPLRSREHGRVRLVTTYGMNPIGWVASSRSEAIDDDWESVISTITLDPDRFTPDSVAGLDEFSHVEVVFVFDQVAEDEVQAGARHPRGNADWPSVGIFAQRAKMRPNRLGVTTCRLLGVDDITLRVEALDAIDGTPVLDVKPVMAEFLPRGEVRQPDWSHELMATYWSRS